MCTHYFDTEKNAMTPYPKGTIDKGTTFLMLEEGRMIFDGSLEQLVNSKNEFVREFLE
jgi:phospholipid/cholesterol/gamma-HCH transport system ATP-binding protein